MDNDAGVASAKSPPKPPQVVTITLDDVRAALTAGLRDFRRAPLYGLFFGGVYAVGGLLILWTVWSLGLPFLAFPMAVGFALISPFVAAGIYEVSRRLERDIALDWPGILGSIRTQASRDMGWMALITTFAFYIWIDCAGIIYLLFFGLNILEPSVFLAAVFTTADGLMFLALGSSVGLVISLVVFSITAISFPLLMDRDIDFVTAMIASVKSVSRNPVPMGAWCLFIVVTMLVSLASMFLLMPITLPILGHMTWHVYRRVIE